MNTTTKHSLLALSIGVLAVAVSSHGQSGAANGEWRSYGGDTGSTKYSPLKQIDRNNVGDLEVAWRWNSPDNALADEHDSLTQFRFEATPLMVNGVLYISTGFNQIAAIDAHTGEAIGVHDPGSWRAGRPTNLGFVHRGVSYWTDGDAERILMGTGDAHLIALDAKTGDVVYEHKLETDPGLIYASSLVADGKIYVPSQDNGTYVIAAKPEFELLAINKFQDDPSRVNASIAVSKGQLIMRTDKAIYCIAK